MMIPVKHDLDVFEAFFGDSLKHMTRMIKTDIIDKKDHYEIKMDFPGYKREDIEVEAQNGYLTVTATKKEAQKQEEGTYIQQERYEGSCQRVFYIGDDVNEKDIKAKFIDGTLVITFPKVDKKEDTTQVIEVQ